MQQQSDGNIFIPTSYITVVTIATTTLEADLQTTAIQIRPISTPTLISSVYNTRENVFALTPSVTHQPPCCNMQVDEDPAIEDISDKVPWQKLHNRTTKRQREKGQNSPVQHPKRSNQTKTQNTNNIYNALNVEETSKTPIQCAEMDHKPPPIFIKCVVNYPLMLKSITTVLKETAFTCRSFANNTVKVNTNSKETYRLLVNFLNQNNISFYTYQPKHERAFRAVIKNLHASIPVEDIKKELEGKGFKIRSVISMLNWKTKELLPMFFVDQEPNKYNKNIYKIQFLQHCKIVVEPPRKKNEIPQCLRCQQYGHTKTYCTKAFYCVKCAGNHSTQQCQKSNDSPAKCILCGGSHPANYRGCKVHKDLQKLKGNKNKQTVRTKNKTNKNSKRPSQNQKQEETPSEFTKKQLNRVDNEAKNLVSIT